MYTTRSGRVVKPPVRYEPVVESFEDDFSDSDYDDESDEDDVDSIMTEDESDESDDDLDENGNLKDFVIEEDSS